MHAHADAPPKVDYDRLAASYDRRYAGDYSPGVAAGLAEFARQIGARTVLEVGCGTGYWLTQLPATVQHRYGLDFSAGMLAGARKREPGLGLARGVAGRLPYANESIDLVYCVNALHHFQNQQMFIQEARRVLRPGGGIAVVGMDPRRFKYPTHQLGGGPQSAWYLYDYFPGTLETDLERHPSLGRILDWLIAAGFSQARWLPVEHVNERLVGEAVFGDPYLKQEATSQLTLLSEEAYRAGIHRIERALARAADEGEQIVFNVDLILEMITASI